MVSAALRTAGRARGAAVRSGSRSRRLVAVEVGEAVVSHLEALPVVSDSLCRVGLPRPGRPSPSTITVWVNAVRLYSSSGALLYEPGRLVGYFERWTRLRHR